MEDLLLDENTKQLSKLLFEISKTIGSGIWDLIKKKGKDLDSYWYSISSKYLSRFYHRFGNIQVLGMHEPMSLSNVFVDINLLNSIETHKYLSIETLKESFEKSKLEIRSLQNQFGSKLDGIALIETESRIMVVGGPGGGKSTYLKKIGIESLTCTNEKLNKYIPIFVELKNIDTENTIFTLLKKELEIAEFPNSDVFLEKSLQNGKLIVLFDGLDEVPTEFENSTIRDIKNFCDRYHKNKFVVSCRIAAYKGGLNNFKNVEIANLNEGQIEAFISKWFKEKSKENGCKDVSLLCWKKISSPEYFSALELAQSPLLLTLLCLVYNYQQDFPKNRSHLYRDALNVLLKEWNSEKRIHSNTVYKDMTLPFEELLLSNIAHHYFLKNEYFFDKIELSNFISDYLNNNLNAPKFLDGSTILDAISVQQGILVERAKNIYSFSHLTFQEYYTAKYIDDHDLTETYINKYLFNPKWREIFILLCGILKAGSDKMLNKIYLKTTKDIEYDTDFQNLLIKLNEFDRDKKVDVRLLNLLVVLLIGTDFCNPNNSRSILLLINEINQELFELVSYSWIVDMKPHNAMHYDLYLSLTQQLKFSSRIIEVLENSLLLFTNHKSLTTLKEDFCRRIGLNFITFSNESKNVINSYFENLIFLFYCKKSSILVTKNNWVLIESNLFKSNSSVNN